MFSLENAVNTGWIWQFPTQLRLIRRPFQFPGHVDWCYWSYPITLSSHCVIIVINRLLLLPLSRDSRLSSRLETLFCVFFLQLCTNNIRQRGLLVGDGGIIRGLRCFLSYLSGFYRADGVIKAPPRLLLQPFLSVSAPSFLLL